MHLTLRSASVSRRYAYEETPRPDTAPGVSPTVRSLCSAAAAGRIGLRLAHDVAITIAVPRFCFRDLTNNANDYSVPPFVLAMTMRLILWFRLLDVLLMQR